MEGLGDFERAASCDGLASGFTLEIAKRKANMLVMSWTDSNPLIKIRADIQWEPNHIDDIIVIDGGLKIVSVGHNIGAVGVSG